MRTTTIVLALLLAACSAPALRPASTPAAMQAVTQATGFATAADARAALAALANVPGSQFHGREETFRTCMQRRFSDSAPEADATIEDPFLRELLLAYHTYWWTALRDSGSRAVAEQRLIERLAMLAGEPAPPNPEAIDALADRYAQELRQRRLHSLPPGRTLPLLDLFVWKRQDAMDFDVQLPGGSVERVRVYLMDDFVSRGWGHFAACGRRGAGGWAKPDGLYAVRSSYEDLESEAFRVTFLGHEAQHFADMRRWPSMQPWLLEYRAKLAELAMARDTAATLLAKFRESQGDDASNNPHPFANRKVLRDLAVRVGTGGQPADLDAVDPEARRRAARDLLVEDTLLRERLEDVNSVR